MKAAAAGPIPHLFLAQVKAAQPPRIETMRVRTEAGDLVDIQLSVRRPGGRITEGANTWEAPKQVIFEAARRIAATSSGYWDGKQTVDGFAGPQPLLGHEIEIYRFRNPSRPGKLSNWRLPADQASAWATLRRIIEHGDFIV